MPTAPRTSPEILEVARSPSIIGAVTEIPEHLLKRSRERRSAIGQGGDSETPAATPEKAASSTPAAAASAAAPAATGPAARTGAPAAPAAPPVKPDPPYVVAAKQRRRIPFWAMATLSLMPIWGFIYVRALTDGPTVVEGPLGEGVAVYSNCASCHGADGSGGVGYAFTDGEVLRTFPEIADQIRWVYYGTEGYNAENIPVYGDENREGGAHVTGELGVMPEFGTQLTDAEIVAVVCHERVTFGKEELPPECEEGAEGADAASEES